MKYLMLATKSSDTTWGVCIAKEKIIWKENSI